VNLLLDTHALLWFLDDKPLLTRTAKSLIEDPANRKFVSVGTCWEIAIKVGLSKLDLGEPATTFLPRELAANHFDLCSPATVTSNVRSVWGCPSPNCLRWWGNRK
jgi:PIN domain nuclease of toxin-antitoxin system